MSESDALRLVNLVYSDRNVDGAHPDFIWGLQSIEGKYGAVDSYEVDYIINPRFSYPTLQVYLRVVRQGKPYREGVMIRKRQLWRIGSEEDWAPANLPEDGAATLRADISFYPELPSRVPTLGGWKSLPHTFKSEGELRAWLQTLNQRPKLSEAMLLGGSVKLVTFIPFSGRRAIVLLVFDHTSDVLNLAFVHNEIELPKMPKSEFGLRLDDKDRLLLTFDQVAIDVCDFRPGIEALRKLRTHTP